MSEDDEELVRKRLKVRDVMIRDPVTIDPDTTVRDAATTMEESKRSCLLIASRGKVVGIVTERDLVRKAMSKNSKIRRSAKVTAIMSSPLVVVSPEATVEEAARIMADNEVRRLPVVDEKGLVGLVTVSDIARALAKDVEYSDSVFNAMARVHGPPRAVYG
jgi:CBS domain-containing protein